MGGGSGDAAPKSRRQDDVELIRVSGPAAYAYEADGPVVGFRIVGAEGPFGVLWAAEDARQDAAGVVYPLDPEAAANAAVHWFRLLREAKAAGVAARDAVSDLARSADPGPWGRLARDEERWPSLGDLRSDVRPDGTV